jgi:hypothetical protein
LISGRLIHQSTGIETLDSILLNITKENSYEKTSRSVDRSS